VWAEGDSFEVLIFRFEGIVCVRRILGGVTGGFSLCCVTKSAIFMLVTQQNSSEVRTIDYLAACRTKRFFGKLVVL